jgi:lipopolysaccharide cholinephosphotransferase
MREIKLKELQQIELDLLVALDDVCRKHSLRYYMDGGTLLGAVCYDGFIPWDDDIDIKMPRPDYDRLLTLQEDFPSHITLDYPRADHCEYTFLKLIDSRTVLEEQNGNRLKSTGVYLDVLPMDGHPSDPETAKKHLATLSRLNSLFHASLSGFSELLSSKSAWSRAKGILYRKLYSSWSLYQKLTETAKKYSFDEAERVGLLVEGDPIRERFEKSWLEPPVMMLFEGHQFPAPNAAEEHLSIFYRKPISRELYYQKLPRIETEHHQRIYWKE